MPLFSAGRRSAIVPFVSDNGFTTVPGRFLIVIDPAADTHPALERGAWLARMTGAAIELLVCHYDEYLAGDRLFDARSLDRPRREILDGFLQTLELLAVPLRREGLEVTTAAIWHHPVHEGIVLHAERIGASVVFKETRHHSALRRALLSHADWALIRACRAPLWLVKPLALPAKPVLLAAVDPLHEHDKPAALDDAILDAGTALAKLTGAELHAFHAYDPRKAVATATANAYIPVSLPLVEIETEMRGEHESRFREVTESHGLAPDRLHLVRGPAHEELPRVARELGASLVIMGAVARNRLQRLFIGSTAERTLEDLPCDLLIVKPDWVSRGLRPAGDFL